RRNIPDQKNKTYLRNCRFDPLTDPLCPVFRIGDIVEKAGIDFDEIAIKVSQELQREHAHPREGVRDHLRHPGAGPSRKGQSHPRRHKPGLWPGAHGGGHGGVGLRRNELSEAEETLRSQQIRVRQQGGPRMPCRRK
ncbi:unnamed protein product, partial [Ixodes persulcatus]